MANPTITSRPNKTVDGFDSNWVSCGGVLPVEYQITNTKFPLNTDDAEITVTNYQTSGGFIQFSCVTTSFSVNDFVTWSITTDAGTFTGVNEVLVIDSAALMTLSIPEGLITGTFSSGTVQIYYNNYAIEVEVYAGINTDHTLTADRPIGLISTISQLPENDNITRVDVSQYVKTLLNPEKNLFGDNDINGWTDFYIKFREVYTGSSTSFIDDSANVFHGVFGVLQFQNSNGGNMAEFVSRSFAGAFMTDFNIPVIYPSISTLSILLESDATVDVIQLDANGDELETNSLVIDYQDRGLYRIPINFTLNSATKNLTIFLL